MIAERGRNRDVSGERHASGENRTKNRGARSEEFGPSCLDQITDIVNRQRASVLYYSVAAGFLYSWLIVPTKGKLVCLKDISIDVLF